MIDVNAVCFKPGISAFLTDSFRQKMRSLEIYAFFEYPQKSIDSIITQLFVALKASHPLLRINYILFALFSPYRQLIIFATDQLTDFSPRRFMQPFRPYLAARI